ncbi:MAG: hypothetical protein LKM36_00240 [Flavobacteriales bacterium]|nr:hypothetical protein [Flavobacteriales bacterium]
MRAILAVDLTWWIMAAHALLLLSIWWQHGVLMDKEALKYTGSAEQILQGDFSGLVHYRLYSAFVLFLVPFLALGSPGAAVAAQVALGLAAAFALRRIVLALNGSTWQADIVFAAFLLLYPIQTWTLALYSESFFVSISVLFLAEALRPKIFWWRFIALAIVVLFARPVGVFFVAPLLAWAVSVQLGLKGGRLIWAAGFGVLLCVLFLPVLDPVLLGVVVEGHAIGGFPKYPGAGESFGRFSLASAELQLIADHGLGAWCVLVFKRIGWLLFAGRPYFSVLHNALMAPVALIYPFAMAALYRQWRNPAIQAMATMLLLNIAIVAFTFAEWNGRFLVPMLPVLIVLAALGLPARLRNMEVPH